MQDEVKVMHAVRMYLALNPSSFLNPNLRDKIWNGEPRFEASMYLVRQCAEYHLILADLFHTSCYNTPLLF